MRYSYWLLVAIALGLGLGIPLLLGGRDLVPVLSQFPPPYLLLLLVMIFLAWNCNSGRLRLLAGGAGISLTHRRALAIIMATEFAICATPGAAGGPLTYGWLLRREGLPPPRSVALYAVDQLADMLFFLAALGFFLFRWLLRPSEVQFAWQLELLAGLLLSSLLFAWIIVRFYRRIILTVDRVLRRLHVSLRYRRRLASWVLEFRRCLRLIRSYSRWRLFALYLLCVVHWLLRYSVLFLAVYGLGGDISYQYAFIVQMLSLTAGQATMLPGGSGGAEMSSGLLLTPLLDPTTAAAAILIWRFVTFYWYLIAGAPVFAVLAGGPLWKRLWAVSIDFSRRRSSDKPIR